MSTVRPDWTPDGFRLVRAVGHAALVGATLYALDGSVGFAVLVAGGTLILALARTLADAVVGDYAGHVLFGAVVLAAAGYFTSLGAARWFVAGLALCGGWLLLDGLQHLRHGVTRDEAGVRYRHDGRVLTGLPKALLARLLEPVRL